MVLVASPRVRYETLARARSKGEKKGGIWRGGRHRMNRKVKTGKNAKGTFVGWADISPHAQVYCNWKTCWIARLLAGEISYQALAKRRPTILLNIRCFFPSKERVKGKSIWGVAYQITNNSRGRNRKVSVKTWEGNKTSMNEIHGSFNCWNGISSFHNETKPTGLPSLTI